ncbi:hypothetical protein PR048_016941 [Dryococelus australis]|uniref:Uncharacterized protein n=1 Tax=Dryococelus australis TaxID=614101 RepID=A0ABQ9H841_9NEOP|nr:hypothetical protein PR048_016941 [Dryococelus australis]
MSGRKVELGADQRQHKSRGTRTKLVGCLHLIRHYAARVRTALNRLKMRSIAESQSSVRARSGEWNAEIRADLNHEVLRADEGEASPEKTRRPEASSGTTPTYENPGAAKPGIEPRSPRLEAKCDYCAFLCVVAVKFREKISRQIILQNTVGPFSYLDWLNYFLARVNCLHTNHIGAVPMLPNSEWPGYGIRKVFPYMSSIGSEACRVGLVNFDPIPKAVNRFTPYPRSLVRRRVVKRRAGSRNNVRLRGSSLSWMAAVTTLTASEVPNKVCSREQLECIGGTKSTEMLVSFTGNVKNGQFSDLQTDNGPVTTLTNATAQMTFQLVKRIWSSAVMKGQEKREIPRGENSPTSGIERHDSHMRKSGSDLEFQRRSILGSQFMSCPGMTGTYGSQLESPSLAPLGRVGRGGGGSVKTVGVAPGWSPAKATVCARNGGVCVTRGGKGALRNVAGNKNLSASHFAPHGARPLSAPPLSHSFSHHCFARTGKNNPPVSRRGHYKRSKLLRQAGTGKGSAIVCSNETSQRPSLVDSRATETAWLLVRLPTVPFCTDFPVFWVPHGPAVERCDIYPVSRTFSGKKKPNIKEQCQELNHFRDGRTFTLML